MLGDKIKEICKEKGLQQKDLAETLNVASQTVSMWVKNNRIPDIETIKKIAAALGVPVTELLEEPPAEPNAALMQQNHIHMIPVFESVSAGFGVGAVDRIIAYTPIFIESDTEAAETICVRVSGDSMYPKIEDGDLVQVHKQDTADTGEIVVILDGCEAYVKRFIHGKNGVVLESLNPAYPPMKYSKEESNELRIVGIVKRIIRDI